MLRALRLCSFTRVSQKYPGSKITGLSNSSTQKTHIDNVANARGLTNLEVNIIPLQLLSNRKARGRNYHGQRFERRCGEDADVLLYMRVPLRGARDLLTAPREASPLRLGMNTCVFPRGPIDMRTAATYASKG